MLDTRLASVMAIIGCRMYVIPVLLYYRYGRNNLSTRAFTGTRVPGTVRRRIIMR